MKKIVKIKSAIFLVIVTSFSFSQQENSLVTNMLLKKGILPATLITTGLILNNSDFEKNLAIRLRNRVGNSFEFRIDDYTQYAPIVEMYIANVLGVKSKHNQFNQTKYLFISNIITSSITHALKRLTLKPRPNGSPYSFPSGHTTFAFTNATVLYNEFNQTSPQVGYSGYVFAVTTGTFRMLNNKHWLSDVLVGAGIGIIVTNLVYHFEPLKSFNPFKD
ncbi:MAG: phosphatase PAP2 family protein [Planctomycetia bacterium]|nr:phosphatase PAP2 family protein [Planctomycetia bacterium]